jgi:hypothetical protein
LELVRHPEAGDHDPEDFDETQRAKWRPASVALGDGLARIAGRNNT